MLCFESMHISLSLFHMIFNCHVCYFVIIFLFPICCCNVDKHWFCMFISYLACHHFNAMLPVGIYPNRASYNSLMKLSGYFMVDHVAHSKFNASNTPKEEITLCQVKGIRWPRPFISFTHQSARCGMLVELAWDFPSPLNV